MPELSALPGAVIAHGLDLAKGSPLAGADPGRLRVVLLGSLSPQKGLSLFEQALPEISAIADFFLIGCGESGRRFAGRRGVRIREHYQRGELAKQLEAVRPHAGLLLSCVPETYSYTLSELLPFGIPVLATRVGSFVDRIEDGRTGFLFDPEPTAVVSAIRTVDADRARLDAVRHAVGMQAGRDLGAMTRDYHALLPLPPVRPTAEFAVQVQASEPRAFSVDPAATYAAALRGFIGYSVAKLEGSPRVPQRLRVLLLSLLRAWRALASGLRSVRLSLWP
jgi:hypothetical protein